MASFPGGWASPQPNVLFNPVGAVQAAEASQRNRLMMDNAREDQAFQQQDRRAAIFERDRNHVAQASQAILALPPEQRPAAYAASLRELQAAGIAPHAPQQYPGDPALTQLARQAMPVAAQMQFDERQQGRAALAGLFGGAPPAAAPAVGAPVGGALPPEAFALQRQAESGGNPNARNPRSSATGADQFIDGTWLEYAQANPDRFQGMTREQILARRTDPDESGRATQWYARENQRGLAAAGLQNGPGELTLAHRFGLGGATAALRADPNTPAAQVFGEAVMRANPDLAGKTVGQVIGQYQQRYSGGGGVAARTGGADMAGPGAPAESGPLAGLTPQQVTTLRGMSMAPGATMQTIMQQAESMRQHNETVRRQTGIDARAEQQLQLSREAAERQAKAAELSAARAGVPANFEPNPEAPGAVRPIVGGPADPAVLEAQARARGEGRGGRPIPGHERNTLIEAATRVGEMEGLRGTFQADFGGYRFAAVGDAANAIARNTPGESARAEWWQRYQSQKNQIRNSLFGAALTPGERAEFEKSDINPGMSAEAIRTNLARQATILRTAQERRVRSMAADGYNTRALEEATGIRVGEDAPPGTEPPPSAGTRPPLTSFGG